MKTMHLTIFLAVGTALSEGKLHDGIGVDSLRAGAARKRPVEGMRETGMSENGIASGSFADSAATTEATVETEATADATAEFEQNRAAAYQQLRAQIVDNAKYEQLRSTCLATVTAGMTNITACNSSTDQTECESSFQPIIREGLDLLSEVAFCAWKADSYGCGHSNVPEPECGTKNTRCAVNGSAHHVCPQEITPGQNPDDLAFVKVVGEPLAVAPVGNACAAPNLITNYGKSGSVERYKRIDGGDLTSCKNSIGTNQGKDGATIVYAAFGNLGCHTFGDYYRDTTNGHGDTIQAAWTSDAQACAGGEF